MTDRQAFISPSTVGRSRGPIVQQQPDIISLVRRRAQQASEYYNSVGLSNGDLPRDSPNIKSDNKRWSETVERKQGGGFLVQPASWSQPSTPVPPSPSKYGASWIKPTEPINIPDNKNSTKESAKFKTLPRKDRSHEQQSVRASGAKARCKSSSQAANDVFSSQLHVVPSTDAKSTEKFTIKVSTMPASEKRNSIDRYNTVPRNFEESGKKTARSIEFENNSRPANGVSADSPLPRVSSHLYEKQLSYTRRPETKSEYKISYTLPHSKPKQGTDRSLWEPLSGSDPGFVQTHEPDFTEVTRSGGTSQRLSPVVLQRQRSHSDAGNDEPDVQPKLSQSYDSTDGGGFLSKTFMRSYGSASSLAEIGRKEDSTMNGLVQEYRKNKIGTDPRSLSPSSKLFKKSHNESPKMTGRLSPKSHRRNKDKYRSKSDVPDHKVLLNKLQNEKDTQERLRHSELRAADQARRRRHNFAHYDWQSMLFSFEDVLVAMETLKRKNTPSGASKAAALAAAASTDSLASKGSSTAGSQEDVSIYLGDDEGLENNKFNEIVASCPYFRNEIGGETDRVICVSATSGLSVQVGNHCDASTKQAQNVLTNHTYLNVVEHGNSDKILPPNSPPSGSVSFGIERVDGGAEYYQTHFFDRDHQNFFGIDEKYGPIVISLRREKLEDRGVGSAHQYRLIVRTCELCTLRGSILEDVVSSSRHPPNKGLPAKDVLEYVCPEINMSCLKVAVATPKVHEQLMKVDEQNLHKAYKIGILYCRAGQSTEEDMYNNEHGSPAFNQFLDLLGTKVKLNGFEDFRGGLDIKTDSTGTESVFTTFNEHSIMFHVSTLLPFTPNNRQQLMRKRHIGNDITTIVFQEPGSEPFNPKYIRSHFQHVFVVVRVQNPCTPNTCYSVAVARSRNIPRFGPPIPENCVFHVSSTFREFLLTKLINGENTAHTTGKFKALAMNTREQYLRDLANNSSTQSGLEGTPRFGRFSISAASRRIRENKEKLPRVKPQLNSHGALTWEISVDDYSRSEIVPCVLGISDCVLLVVEKATKRLIFSVPCQAVLGWTVATPNQEQLKTCQREMHIYYGRGERISIYTDEVEARDEITLRLEKFTKGTQTVYRQLRRNAQGSLGMHVNYEGVIMEVEPHGYASLDGLKQSSRLVEICKVAVATMSHEEILDLLRTSDRVKVVVIPPNDDGTPRKCSMELYHLYPVLDVKKNLVSSTLTFDLSHVQKKPQSAQRPADRQKAASKLSSNTNNLLTVKYKQEDSTANLHSGDPVFSPLKVKVHKPLLTKTFSGNDTKATLTATATRLALVGVTSGYMGPRTRNKSAIDSNSQSSATNTMSSTKSTSSNLSNYSGHDVEWTNGKLDETLVQSSTSLSSDSGMNSNNNSSYSSTLSRCSTNTPTASDQKTTRSCSRDFQSPPRNKNNNLSSLEHQGTQARSKRRRDNNDLNGPSLTNPSTPQSSSHSFTVDCTPSSDINRSLRVYIAGTDAYKKSKLNQSQSSTPSTSVHCQSRSEPAVSTPIRWKQPSLTSRSNSEISKKPLNPSKVYVNTPKAKKSSDIQQAGPRLRAPPRDRASPNNPPSQKPTSDVQSSLIRLLTTGSPTKPVASKRSSPTRKSPLRSASQRTSPKRRPSPSRVTRITRKPQPLHRTMSDESLCGARADEVILARQGSGDLADSTYGLYGHQASGSVDSLSPMHGKYIRYGDSPGRNPSPIRGQPSFPLPVTTDWDRLLDAAKAAEVLEASSVKSVSMGTLNDLGEVTPDLSYPTNGSTKGKRTMSVEHLYDHDHHGYQDDQNSFGRMRNPPVSRNLHYSANPVTSQAFLVTQPASDTERRLERVEREMRLLQEKLKQEQESKKVLENKVSSLRRDNTRLLRHVRSDDTDITNGYKRTKRKSSKS